VPEPLENQLRDNVEPTGFRQLVYYFRRLGPAGVLALITLTLPPLGSIVLLYYINEVGEWFRSHQQWGPAIYVLAFWVLVGLALLPTYASAIVGAWAFGFTTGCTAALIGFSGAALIGYLISSLASGDRVVKLIEEKPKWRIVYDALLRSSKWKAFLIVFLLRVPPNSPFAATNLLLASTRVPLGIFLLATLLGMTPRTAAVALAASRMSELSLSVPEHRWTIALGIVLTILVLVVIGMIGKHALDRVTNGSIPRTDDPRDAPD
jgi:uncharacterized membrane protein YdjX (TVP38/TMEM64 family)